MGRLHSVFRWGERRSAKRPAAYRRYTREPRGAEAAAMLTTLSDEALQKLSAGAFGAIFALRKGNNLRLLALERLKRQRKGSDDG